MGWTPKIVVGQNFRRLVSCCKHLLFLRFLEPRVQATLHKERYRPHIEYPRGFLKL